MNHVSDQHRRTRRSGPRAVRRRLATVACLAVGAGLLNPPAAVAASVTSAAFSGGAGTAVVGGSLYARHGAPLTLSVTTSSDTQCVVVSGAFDGQQASPTPKSSWSFSTTAGAGDGAQAVTVAPSPNVNNNGKCTGQSTTAQASYVLDNTGPAVTAALSPRPNAAGWNNTDTTVTWTATDTGSGVASGPNPASSSETANGVMTRTSTATDGVGNTGAGAVTVRVDKAAPAITATQTSAGYGQPTTVTFSCDDSNSGGGEASGIASCVADGTDPASSSKTIDGNGTVTGTATDVAGNTKTLSVEVRNVDTTPPTLSGTATTRPNGNGWYRDDVTIRWTAADPESGIPTPPADTVIAGEGSGLTSSTSVRNGAGLETTATSSPAVSIDRRAPMTALTGASDSWVNGAVRVSLAATDNLSGVASTSYSVDGAPTQTGSSFTLSDEGSHTVTYFSTDQAGNREDAKTATIRIDRTAPTISHRFTPDSYTDGAWTNTDVTVTFDCADQGGSGLAGCTAPVTASDEGGGQQVTGTATDHAGNSASDTATVSIDKTAPTATAHADREPNDAGWYADDVTVSFRCSDALSGVTSCPAAETLGEGADQNVSGTARDAAGNTAGARVSGIDVDKTAPLLSGSAPRGWHTGDVTVTWTASDALSGLAGPVPAPSTVTGEGANLSATTSVRDRAGNATQTTVDGIMIDRTAPTTTAELSAPRSSGWYDEGARVILAGHDPLSGVAVTYYSVDGGAAQRYDSAFSVTTEGVHELEFWSVDVAGNVEPAGPPVTLRVDRAAPTTTVVNPISPASGWFVTSGIPVAFDADDAVSGVAATYYTIDGGEAQVYGEPFTADLPTGRHTITYWSVDVAGNAEAARRTEVNVDTVAPSITGTATPAPNALGWNNTPVEVTFSCTDDDSGIATGLAGCAGDTTLANEGADQTVRGDAVDVAGNRSWTTVGPVDIDLTRPTLSGAPTTDANGAGWYKGDVTIRWTGTDRLSGINPATQPADSVISGEGADLGAGPETIEDRAGNVSAPAAVSGIRIDRTAPQVTGQATSRTAPIEGWYRDEVVVEFTCTDNLSGVASCPTSMLLRGDGADQSVTSGPAADVAGNIGAGATVRDIDIDGTAPSTTADNRCTQSNGWCTGATADVVLTATDQPGLSGVREIRYRVNGAAEQVAAGSSATVSVPLDGEGEATVTYQAVDVAGNVERTSSVALRYDNIAPAVTHTLTPAPNADGWNNSDVTVHFDAKDGDAGSGVDPSTVTEDVVVSEETSGLLVTGSAADIAGNVGRDQVTVKLDKTAPRVSAAVLSGTRGDNGWYVGPVTVGFACSDALSSVATCSDDVVLTSNGENTASGSATDRAGNRAATTLGGILIDQEKPTITGVNVAGGSYTLGSVPAATCTASDSFSGVRSCTVTVTGGKSNGVGSFSYTATAVDQAGNTSTATGTYTVKYRFDGFLQPINDTAHQVGTSTSIFKAGSTVPAKFQLKNAQGQVVQAATAPVWLTPVKGSATTAPVDESVYSASADSGSTYRYDATGQHYIYNWKTGAGGSYWRVGVTLDDGQTYYVNIGLR
ncbi:MAG: PxKF domain-containing protein [Actinomycetota bacterium]|nr:PxKF domain-containing protein [Actinomycetota bacterium]